MFVARVLQDRHRHFEELGIDVWIGVELAARLAQQKFGVLLVSQTISRDMFGLEADRFFQGRAPLRRGLTGQPKHKNNIDICESRRAQNGK